MGEADASASGFVGSSKDHGMSDKNHHHHKHDAGGHKMPDKSHHARPRSLVTNVLRYKPGERFHHIPDKPPRVKPDDKQK